MCFQADVSPDIQFLEEVFRLEYKFERDNPCWKILSVLLLPFHIAFEISSCFIRKYFNGKSADSRYESFIIPVCALDKTNGKGKISFFRKKKKSFQFLFRTHQISLKDNSQAPPVRQLRMVSQLFKKRYCHFIEAVLFHIEIDKYVFFSGF